jgi:K+/H+ antiporter YhaU regulatory subunit KhtT
MRQRWGLGVVAVQRGREVVASPLADFTLQAGDVLVVFGSRERIAAFDSECG